MISLKSLDIKLKATSQLSHSVDEGAEAHGGDLTGRQSGELRRAPAWSRGLVYLMFFALPRPAARFCYLRIVFIFSNCRKKIKRMILICHHMRRVFKFKSQWP